MKLEEKIINGVLHYRWYSDSEFIPYTAEELTAIIYSKEQGFEYKCVYNEKENSLDLTIL